MIDDTFLRLFEITHGRPLESSEDLDHGRRRSWVMTPWGNEFEIADDPLDRDEAWRHVMFREVYSAYLNDAPKETK